MAKSSEEKLLFKASIVAISGNFTLAVAKLSAGLISGSMAVVSDGVDTSADILTSTITLIAAWVISFPPNNKYPFGYFKADAIASKVVSFIVLFAGAQLFFSSAKRLLWGNEPEMPTEIAIYVTVFSIIVKLLLSLYLFRMGRRSKSSMILANAKNMQADIIISLSVLFGLGVTFWFNMPWLDIIAALAVSIWIMRVGVLIFKETLTELMDGSEDPAIYNRVFEAVSEVKEAHNPHRTRIRKIGNSYSIDMDIEVDGRMTVFEAHKTAHNVEKAIKEKLDNIFDVVVHIEPIGHSQDGERFGVSESDT